jgi:hypothetical protein
LPPPNPPLPLQLNTSLWGLYTGPSLCCCSGCDNPQWLSQNCPKRLRSWPTKLPRTCCCSSPQSCPKSTARVAVPALKVAQNLPLTAVPANSHSPCWQSLLDPSGCPLLVPRNLWQPFSTRPSLLDLSQDLLQPILLAQLALNIKLEYFILLCGCEAPTQAHKAHQQAHEAPTPFQGRFLRNESATWCQR